MLTGNTHNRSNQQHKRPWRVAYVHQSIYLQANVQFCELRHTFKGAKYFESAMMKISATDGTWKKPRAGAQDAHHRPVQGQQYRPKGCKRTGCAQAPSHGWHRLSRLTSTGRAAKPQVHHRAWGFFYYVMLCLKKICCKNKRLIVLIQESWLENCGIIATHASIKI